MATLLSNFVWEGLSSEMEGASARDGHIYKQLDTGESYIRVLGEWQFINLGLSFIKATKSGLVSTDADGFAHITFTTPFISTDYTVALSPAASPWPYIPCFDNLTTSGFDVYTRDTRNGAAAGNKSVSWVATRNYNP